MLFRVRPCNRFLKYYGMCVPDSTYISLGCIYDSEVDAWFIENSLFISNKQAFKNSSIELDDFENNPIILS